MSKLMGITYLNSWELYVQIHGNYMSKFIGIICLNPWELHIQIHGNYMSKFMGIICLNPWELYVLNPWELYVYNISFYVFLCDFFLPKLMPIYTLTVPK